LFFDFRSRRCREQEEQTTVLSAWAGDGTVPLLAKSFEENGAALPLGRIVA